VLALCSVYSLIISRFMFLFFLYSNLSTSRNPDCHDPRPIQRWPSHDLSISTHIGTVGCCLAPSVSWFLKKAAGIETASSRPGHSNVSSATLRHVYEIAKLKQADPFCKHMPLEALCKSIIGTANSMGIEIVKDL
jgi:hypothetical protein